MAKIKVSIIVPVYNVEKYISKCLDSLINQTLREIEIIVVNDGSPDNSQKIIDTYMKKYPKLIKAYIKKNGGLSSARNYGLKRAKGEYIGFVDSDDYVELSMYEEMYKKALKNKSDIVICGIDYSYSNYNEENHLFNCNKKLTQKEYLVLPPAAWNKLYRKEFLMNNNFKFPQKIFYEDLSIVPSLSIYTNKIIYIDKCFYNYRQNDNSIMNISKYNEKINDIFDALDNLYNIFKKNNVLENYYYELEQIYIHHLLYGANYRFIKYKESKNQIYRVADIMKKNFPNWYNNKCIKKFSYKERITMKLFYYKQLWLIELVMKVKHGKN